MRIVALELLACALVCVPTAAAEAKGPWCPGPEPGDIEGTSAGERLRGTSGPDAIYGAGGERRDEGAWWQQPVVCGGGGKDRIRTGTEPVLRHRIGRSQLTGGPGHDKLIGGSGGDVLAPRSGDDLLFGGPGPDTAWYSYARGPLHVNLATGQATGKGADVLHRSCGSSGETVTTC